MLLPYYVFSPKMDDRLRSAESAIAFIQNEHERVLHGLHMEIERLQQKCSGRCLFSKVKFVKPQVTILVCK